MSLPVDSSFEFGPAECPRVDRPTIEAHLSQGSPSRFVNGDEHHTFTASGPRTSPARLERNRNVEDRRS